MRDDRDFTVQETITYSGPTGSSVSKPIRTSVRSFRSDIVKTTPSPTGEYVRTTGYDAFFMNTSTRPGKVQWVFDAFGTRTNNSLEWTGGEVAQSVWRHGCNSLLAPDIPLSVVSQARSILASQIRDDLDVSVMLGEAKETVTGLAGILNTLWNMLQIFPQRKWRRFIAMTVREVRNYGRGRAAAKAYLTWLYGIRPLISDAQRIMDNWDRFTEEPVGKPLFVEVRDGSFQLPSRVGFSYSGKVSRGVSTGAYAYIVAPDQVKFSRMGLLSPLSLAWELTTLSFVVDWFFHVGNFIQTWEGTAGVGIAHHWETRWVNNLFLQTEDRYKRNYASAYTRITGDYDKMETWVRLKAMRRIGAPFLLPAPPYFSWGIRESTAAAAAALAVTRLRGFRKLYSQAPPPVAQAF